MAERIFKPLGMMSTTVIDQWEVVGNRAPGYTLRQGKLARIRRDDQIEMPSAFGILSNVKDLARWDATLNTEKLLKKASLEQMWTPFKLNKGTASSYGFGWYSLNLRGRRLLYHTGVTGTEIFRLPEDGVTIIVLTNLGQNFGSDPVNSTGLSYELAEHLVPGLEDKETAVRELARGLLLKAIDGNIDPGLFAPPLRIPAVMDKVKATGAALKSFGQFRSIVLWERKEEAGKRTYRYLVNFQAETGYLVFTLNNQNQIVDLRFARTP